jgi:hypothetical protein
LEQVLAAAHGTSDAKVARQLSGLELTERMSNATLTSWKTRLPGAKATAMLVALADLSAFLNPPPVEIPANAPPDLATQRHMISLVGDYLKKTIPKLPDFIATQTTVRYEEYLPADELQKERDPVDRPLQRAGSSSETVFYRNGIDVVDAPEPKENEKKSRRLPRNDLRSFDKEETRLDTRGIFGSLLSRLIPNILASSGVLSWSHWEQSDGGVRAVFHYAVPEGKSQYQIQYCCLPDGDGTDIFKKLPGYHGKIMIDPVSGAILRMTVEAELQSHLPVNQSKVMVEYGPVEIGGKTYICPVRSISIMRERSVRPSQDRFGRYRVYRPYMSLLNDVAFEDYHIFRAESRILTGYELAPEGEQENPGSTRAPAAAPKTQP